MSFVRSLFRRTSMKFDEARLESFYSTFDLIAMGVGCSVGIGVYVLSGDIAKQVAGPSIILSFVIAALASLLSGFCLAEFGARVPRTGSCYVFAYVAIGEFIAFLLGWNLILEYAIGTSTIAKGFSNYIDGVSNHTISGFLTDILPLNVPFLGKYVDLFSFSVIMLLAIALSFGARETSNMNNFFVIVKVAIITVIVICGLIHADVGNWSLPKEKTNGFGNGGFFAYGAIGVLKGASKCYYAFIGFDSIASAGGEIRDPHKKIPKLIIGTIAICAAIYISVSVMLTLVEPYSELDDKAPLSNIFNKRFGWTFVDHLATFGSILGLFASLYGTFFSIPRIFFAMSSDGLMFSFLSYVTARRGSMIYAILVSGLLTGTVSAFFEIESLISMISIGTLTTFTVISMCVLILEFENKTEYFDEREEFWTKFFNLDSSKIGTDFTSTFANCAISIYTILCIILCILLQEFHEEIANLNWELTSTVIVLIIFMILCMTILSRQPRTSHQIFFECPMKPWFPALSIFVNIYLLVQLEIEAWIRFAVWVTVGIVFYFSYSKWNSRLATRNHGYIAVE